MSDTARVSNRLGRESSPYLLQHQYNPVDWYSWGEEAFSRARERNVPIFLSVGYSTCYWCHVMERECFENDAIAEVMNRLFVCIKVDREERPDVDQLYMTAIQVISRQGGWPMSVFLTPDRRPFYGGTYFPPADLQGRPGFPRLCHSVADAWKNRPDEVSQSADQIVGMLRKLGTPPAPSAPITFDANLIGSLIDRSVADYEPTFGGFGHAPKFPRETVLELLLSYLASDLDERVSGSRTPKTRVRQMTLHALDAMMHGGIRDHLSGGFHRYSTDAKWLVPHFEIMLYDNAMLLACYAEAHRQTGDARYAQVAVEIADFVLREMTSPQGGFFTAIDAEVDGQEGLNYLWTLDQVELALGPEDASRFSAVYGLAEGPNFADPHHGNGVPDKNILHIARPRPGQLSPLLDLELRVLRQKLYDVRATRKQPLLDTKIITSWNGLMIRALAIAGRILSKPLYIQAAERAAVFLLTKHRLPDGRLSRTSRDDVTKYAGFLDDYAALAHGLCELGDASGNSQWKSEAQKLAATMDQTFGSSAGGLYFTDALATDLVVRQQTASDSPLPSGNASAALAFLSLGQTDRAEQVVAAFSQGMFEHAEGMASLVQAAMLAVQQSGPFTVEIAPVITEAGRPVPLETVAADVVTVNARWRDDQIIAVHLQIASGWHVYAHDVALGLVPITVRLVPAELAAKVSYPAGDLYAGAGAEPVLAHEGEITITIAVKKPHDSAALRVVLTYQACDESRCLPTVRREIAILP